MDSPNTLYRRLEMLANEHHLMQTSMALPYMEEKHAGQFRRRGLYTQESVPYIIHPLTMACHAASMGIIDDTILTVILLHDVCEDCHIEPDVLPFSGEVKRIVNLLTFRGSKQNPTDMELYYKGIAEDETASFVKALDRCNNVSEMATSFPKEKLIRYMEETETYVLPLLTALRCEESTYRDAAFIIEYHTKSILESLHCILGSRHS